MANFLKKHKRKLLAAAALLFWTGVWAAAALITGQSLILPGPAETLKRLCELASGMLFWKTVFFSFGRILLGTAAGTAAGIAAGILVYLIRGLDIILGPLVTVVRAVPVASFIIIAMLWIGKGMLPSFISFLMVFPIVYVNVKTGLYEISPEHRKLIPAFGMSRAARLKYIYIPSVAPYFLPALTTGAGLSWKAGIAAEVLAFTPVSIGRNLSEAKNYLETVDLFAWTLAVILISLLMEYALSAVSKKRKQKKPPRTGDTGQKEAGK